MENNDSDRKRPYSLSKRDLNAAVKLEDIRTAKNLLSILLDSPVKENSAKKTSPNMNRESIRRSGNFPSVNFQDLDDEDIVALLVDTDDVNCSPKKRNSKREIPNLKQSIPDKKVKNGTENKCVKSPMKHTSLKKCVNIVEEDVILTNLDNSPQKRQLCRLKEVYISPKVSKSVTVKKNSRCTTTENNPQRSTLPQLNSPKSNRCESVLPIRLKLKRKISDDCDEEEERAYKHRKTEEGCSSPNNSSDKHLRRRDSIKLPKWRIMDLGSSSSVSSPSKSISAKSSPVTPNMAQRRKNDGLSRSPKVSETVQNSKMKTNSSTKREISSINYAKDAENIRDILCSPKRKTDEKNKLAVGKNSSGKSKSVKKLFEIESSPEKIKLSSRNSFTETVSRKSRRLDSTSEESSDSDLKISLLENNLDKKVLVPTRSSPKVVKLENKTTTATNDNAISSPKKLSRSRNRISEKFSDEVDVPVAKYNSEKVLTPLKHSTKVSSSTTTESKKEKITKSASKDSKRETRKLISYNCEATRGSASSSQCNSPVSDNTYSLENMRHQLLASTIPQSLPCRDKEFNNIYHFIARKLEDMAGGCMYISGVPGTGKTATVHAVVKKLQVEVKEDDLPDFDFVEINALRLTEPRQAYVRMWQTLTGKRLTAEQAQRSLDHKFSSRAKKPTVLLVDELDYLCTRRQDVVYNILDWPTKQGSSLVIITIANTMDLPERTLKGKVTSRMGLTRVVFQPYTHHQLQEIVMNRISGSKSFHPDAIQLVARKVAAVSGDARRALDICRRATELIGSSGIVTIQIVEQALNQIFSGRRIRVIKSCSVMAQLVLRALRDESLSSGVDECTVGKFLQQLLSICTLEGVEQPTVGTVLSITTTLDNLGLIVAEKKGRPDLDRKLSLNVSADDIHYALSC